MLLFSLGGSVLGMNSEFGRYTLAAKSGIAASYEGPFPLGKATKVGDINAMLRAEGVLPEGYSIRFTSRNNMVVRNAAGYGAGADVQALGSLKSVGWQPTRSGMASLHFIPVHTMVVCSRPACRCHPEGTRVRWS